MACSGLGLLAAFLLLLPSALGDDCSCDCSNEFYNSCYSPSDGRSYDFCRNELDNGVGLLGSLCVAQCSDTPAMASISPSLSRLGLTTPLYAHIT